MGIPGYFGRHILPKYAEAIKNNLPNSGEEFIEAIEFDMGGIMHSCAAAVYSYGDYYDSKRSKEVARIMAQKEGHLSLIKDFCATVCERLENLVLAFIKEVNPRYKRVLNLVIAMDGVAPFAKVLQQRTRRYRASVPTENKDNHGKIKMPPPAGWDTSSITPGTEFMDIFDRHIRDWITKPDIRNLVQNKIIFSSYRTRGEGEHKPFLYREEGFYSSREEEKRNSKDRGIICAYGLDADLILLNLLHEQKNVYIIREKEVNFNPRKTSMGTPFHGPIIDLDILRDKIVAEMTSYKKVDRFSTNVYYSVIRDYVLMTFFLGNDFLPRILAFMDLDTSLTEFIKIYSLYIFNTIKEEDEGEVTLLKKDRDNLTSDNGFLSREDGGINWKTLLLLLDKLRDLEPEYLLSIGKGQKRDVRPEKDMPSNSKALDKGITIHKKKYTLDITVFRNWWYTLVLGPKTKIMRQFLRDHDISFATQEDVEQMCDSYMKGLQWVLLYYVRGTLSVNRFWSYPYTQSPTMFDIYKVCRVMVKKKKTIHITPLLDKESDPFFGPLHQLLAVLPPKSSNLIDKKYSDLITGVRPLSYLAPVYFRIDYENARVDHEGLAILPIVDPFQIIEEVKKATPPRLIKRYLLGENFDTIILSQNHEDGIEYSEKEIKTLRWENRQEAIRLFGADFKDKKDSSHKKPYVKRDKEVKPYNKNYKGNNYNSNYKGKGKNKDTKISMRVEL